jgi:hypothetical protein
MEPAVALSCYAEMPAGRWFLFLAPGAEEQDMAASASASASQPARRADGFGRLWWLPAGGEGNGLDDTAWAPLARGDASIMRALLTELRQTGVPAYAAPVTRRPTDSRYQLWVGTSRYSQAEELVRVRLPVLQRACRGPAPSGR